MLHFDFQSGQLSDQELAMTFADQPYQYEMTGKLIGEAAFIQESWQLKEVNSVQGGMCVKGVFHHLGIELKQTIQGGKNGLQETLQIENIGDIPVDIEKLAIGFRVDLNSRAGWHLCAIPFRVQLDGSRHDYTSETLKTGEFKNAVFEDTTRKFMPPLTEEGVLRSEAWAWGDEAKGLVIIKYNNQEVELSIASPSVYGNEAWLRFGGAGFCLYGEPGGARHLEAGQSFTFGMTSYQTYQNGINQAFTLYREFLEQHGHTFPKDYNPPINWNELYDVGWYHSRPEELKKYYTRQALLNEAKKAEEIGCELLYLDPGWEVCEGTTLWDESRLGDVKSLVHILKEKYGLSLGYRTILRTYEEYWPKDHLIQHNDLPYQPVAMGDQLFWEPCLCDNDFWREKLQRILAISQNGIRFMMVDEFDWRGACINPNHHHPVPTRPRDHIMADYGLCKAIRQACPGLTIEAHDPVWPWSNSIYVPTYFQQGFGEKGSYDENWGFEYMWDCLNDLRSGRALALYYYNLGCSIPIYLHITMAADNDACVFFWWVASTVRHLGIGGKVSNKTIEPPEGLPKRDPEERFAAYKEQMKVYKKLKPFFVRGEFHGIAENAHLHTLPEKKGGVLNLFNLTDQEQTMEFFISSALLKADRPLKVENAQADWSPKGVTIRSTLAAMSPMVIWI